MQYIGHANSDTYSGDKPAHWRDVPVTSDPPGPDHVPVLEDISVPPYKRHVGWEHQPQPVTTDDVDAERDRRIDDGMVWDGVTYQTRPQDRENVAGASILALAAISNGAQPGDLRWHGEDTDFVWIAEDNSLNPMDAPTFFAFAQAMAKHKSAHIFAARAIKDMDTIPADYATNEAYWP